MLFTNPHVPRRVPSSPAGQGFRLCALAMALAASCSVGPASAAPIGWTGASSFWDIATNWSSNPQLPGASDDVTIDVSGVRTITVRATGGPFFVQSLDLGGDDNLSIAGGALTVGNSYAAKAGTSVTSGSLVLNGASSMASLTQAAAGTIGGTGQLTVTGSAALSGTHTGMGSTVLQGASSISGLNLDAGRVLTNQGTVTLTGSMNLNPANNTGAGRVDNAAGALFDVRTFNLSITASNLPDLQSLAGHPAFHNAGTFRKSTGGNYGVGVFFDNTGTIDVQQGNFSFAAGSSNGGANTFASGASLTLSAGTHDIGTGASFSGPGVLTVAGAATVVNLTGPVTIASAFTQSGGTLQGGDLALTGTTTLAISSSLGMMSGAGTTRLQGTTGISSFSLDAGRVLRNEATTNVTGSIELNRTLAAGAGRIDNAAGALLDIRTSNHAITSDNNGAADNGLDAYLRNAGIVRRSTLGNNYSIGVRFENLSSGVVDLVTGGLTLSGGGDHRGGATLAAGTTLALGGGTHDIHAGASFSGLGTFAVNGASTVVNVDTPLTITSAFSQSGGTIQGSDLTLAGPTALGISSSLGYMTGPATTTLQGATTFGGPNAFSLDAKRVLRNEGNAVLAGSIQLNRTNAVGAGRLENAASGVIDVQTFNLAISSADQGPLDRGQDARFDNAGLLKKTSAGNYTIAVPFFNTGTVSVEKGSLTFSQGIAGHSGRIVVGAGTTLSNAGLLDNRGIVQGSGTISAPTLSNHGTVSPGLSPGTLTLQGNFEQSGDGLLDIELASLATFDSLVVSGTANLDGSLQLRPFGGYAPVVGDSFVVLRSAGGLSGTFGQVLTPETGGFAAGVDFDVLYDYGLGTVTLQVAAVPEPETWGLLLAGLAMVGWAARRRRGHTVRASVDDPELPGHSRK